MIAWLSGHVLSFVSGAVLVAALRFVAPTLWSETRAYFRGRAEARRAVRLQLDPLLKAADELQGKLLSQAKGDFSEFRGLVDGDKTSTVRLCSTLFLFAQLWARIELLRRESFHAELARETKGKQLLAFTQTLESRPVRLVERAWQRGMGESLLVDESRGSQLKTFRQFVDEYEASPSLRSWFQPLEKLLRSKAGDGEKPWTVSQKRKTRQRLLRYGVVVHALIDTLDKKHYTTKPRPGYPNKLNRMSRHELIYRIFKLYLPGVKNVEKYVGLDDQNTKGPAASRR